MVELGERERAAIRRLLRGEATVAETAIREAVSRRELVHWRREYLAERLPPRSATVTLPVEGPVTLRWDRWGVPHIAAANLSDLCLGLGYAMAQERLWQLDYLRRQARGELAAVLGHSALEGDKAMRIIGLGRLADAVESGLTADEATALGGLTAGINAWLDQLGDRLPIEFEVLDYRPAPWRVADSIAIWKWFQWWATGRLENITIAEAGRRNLSSDWLPPYLAVEAGQETIIPGGRPGGGGLPTGAGGLSSDTGSNNWAVAPSRTTTGAPVLCSDPHQPFQQPGQYFECHLQGAGLDAVGAVYVGTTGWLFGRNRELAWGVTNHSVSVRDLYVEEVEIGDSNRYREGEVWRAFQVDEQAIAVRDDKTEYISVRRTVRGPVVSSLVPELDYWSGPPLSLRWVGFEAPLGLQSMLDLVRAESIEAARTALRGWPLPVLNFLLADVAGGIAYQTAGQVPERPEARRGYRKAGEAADVWGERYAFETLPHEVRPARGWLASANNPPWPADEPWVKLGVWADGYRMQRIRERLEAREQHTPAEIGAIQADTVSARAVDLAPRLAWWLNQTGEPELVAMADQLTSWDGSYDRQQVAPTIFETIWQVWLERVADGQFPTRLLSLVRPQCAALARDILCGHHHDWFRGKPVREHLRAAGREAHRLLVAAAGPDPAAWRWGRLHRVVWPHALAERKGLRRLSVGPFATSGGNSIVRAATHGDTPPFRVTAGSTYRLLADLADPTQAWSVSPTGQSGHPASPHYQDQTALWLSDRYKPLWLDETKIMANLEGVTELVPAAR